MEKEEKLFSVQSRLNDQDYDDVFRVYLEEERGREKKRAIISCSVLFAICILLFFINHYNIVFIFYGIGCLIVGAAYLMVPVNKKFIATNRLMFGMQRETVFYPHAVSTMEIYEDEDSTAMTEEELEEATTVISTGAMVAYENERAFLFAEGKISNQFLYIPKRGLSEEQLTNLREFAQERCSGGYHLIEVKSMVADDDAETEKPAEESTDDSVASDMCGQFYGAKHLHLRDDEGRPIDFSAETEENSEPESETESKIASETESAPETEITQKPEDEEENPADE